MLAIDEEGAAKPLAELNDLLPSPSIEGPFFASGKEDWQKSVAPLSKTEKDIVDKDLFLKGETTQLQRALQRYGYLARDAAVDGW